MTLISRLEAAPCGSRELDAEIHTIVRRWPDGDRPAPYYTESFDAAITALPEHWDQWRLISKAIISCGVEIRRYEGRTSKTPDIIQAQAYTEPLAMCSAAMKARQQHGGEGR